MLKLLILLLVLFAQVAHAQQAPASAPTERLYREVELRYVGYVEDGNEVALYSLRPFASLLNAPMSREECAEVPKLAISDVFDMGRPSFNDARRLWVDWDAGFIGLEGEDKQYFFVRVICLPQDVIDELDLVGVGRKYPPPKNPYDYPPADSPYGEIRYDPQRFFERFEKYGVTSIFKVPETKPREAWDSNAWNKTIFIFPLDGKNK